LHSVVLPPPDGAEMTINNGLGLFSDMRENYSTFWACSRNFSSSALSVTTAREIRLSLAFEPMVFISRFISARENQAPAHRLPGCQAIVKLLEMALQARQFLGNVRPVRKVNNFLEQSLVVRRRRFHPGVLDAQEKLFA